MAATIFPDATVVKLRAQARLAAALRTKQRTLLEKINADHAQLRAKRTSRKRRRTDAYPTTPVPSTLVHASLRPHYEQAARLAAQEFLALRQSLEATVRRCTSLAHTLRQTNHAESVAKSGTVIAAEATRASTRIRAHVSYAQSGAAQQKPKTPTAKTRPTQDNRWRGHRGDIWSHTCLVPPAPGAPTTSKVLSPGDLVAALVDTHSKPCLWIQAKIKSRDMHPGGTVRYSVYDADPAASVLKLYRLPPEKILPLPPLAVVPSSERLQLWRGARALAVYPVGGITTLYPASILKRPNDNGSTDYLVRFDDDDGAKRLVGAHHVVPMLDQWAEPR